MDSPVEWRVPTLVPTVKLLLAGLFVVVTVTLGRDLVSAVVGLLVAAGLGVAGLRDLLVPVRLTAGTAGLTVTNWSGRHQYTWPEIVRIRIDDRRRLIGRSVMLEVDVDTNLYFFSRFDLGVAPIAALDDITALRTGHQLASD